MRRRPSHFPRREPPGGAAAAPQPGWHWTEWGAELLGTALLLLGGGSAVTLDFGTGSPIAPVVPSHSLRLLVTGVLFAGAGSLVALTPFGRRSGAHLNPAVTLAFWTQGRVHRHDLGGYVLAQCLGALAGTAVLAVAWGQRARSVRLDATAPGSGLTAWQAALVEAGMTCVLILVLFAMTSSAATTRWTPLAAWIVVALLVWQGAPYTGTSLNPARSFGPAVLAPLLRPLWAYCVGPVAGALAAAAVFAGVRSRSVLTAKLFHDPRYRSTLGSDLAVRRAPAG